MIGRLYDVLHRATTSLLRLEGLIESLPGRSVLLAAMRVREAQASSRIENTFASVREIALASVDERGASSESMEVLRNRLAIEYGLASKLPISARLLREMHRVLIVDPGHRPGQFRDRQVCIGDQHRGFSNARFVPPGPERVEACMTAWEFFVNPKAINAAPRARLPYLIELAMSHYQFETIHPFSDGNGRLGRALVTLAPVKDRELRHPVCNLSEWVQANRQEYYDGLLRVSTHGEWEPWIRFFVTALAQQAEADLNRATRVSSLYDKYQKLVTTRGKSILRIKLLDHLFDRQVVTITIAAKVMDVSYAAAQAHVIAFETMKIIKPLSDKKYGKIYVAEGVLKAIRGQGQD